MCINLNVWQRQWWYICTCAFWLHRTRRTVFRNIQLSNFRYNNSFVNVDEKIYQFFRSLEILEAAASGFPFINQMITVWKKIKLRKTHTFPVYLFAYFSIGHILSCFFAMIKSQTALFESITIANVCRMIVFSQTETVGTVHQVRSATISRVK